jgi:hypothetical protein
LTEAVLQAALRFRFQYTRRRRKKQRTNCKFPQQTDFPSVYQAAARLFS